MGSISKKPKAPTIQYVVAPTPSYTPTTPAVNEPVVPSKTDDQISGEARTESLLRRTRGRLGTIATSFKGFLSGVDSPSSPRKTLLGE